ncbi:MAG: hypothetical protein GX221_02145 [Candidatus Riflebacteria bacterium]|nr:hypothetical protein [Candidatus Riflebacteria bacterium]
MSFNSWLVNRNSSIRRNFCILAAVAGSLVAVIFIALGFFVLKIPLKNKLLLIGTSVGGGVLSAVIVFFICRLVFRAVILFVSNEVVSKLAFKEEHLYSDKTGMQREIDIFEQTFNSILAVLKRVLQISLKLEVASDDLDRTAQISSRVIKEVVDEVGNINNKAEDNADNLRDTIASLESNFALSKDVSAKLLIAKEDSQSVSQIADATQSSVKDAVETMLKIKDLTDSSTSLVNDLNDSSKKIGTILTEIANIAEQTNLLALNAAIEAARAGEQGLGFAVVAEEVRKLARASADSSKKINTLINDILVKTENAAEMMQDNTLQVNQGLEAVNAVDGSLSSMLNTTVQLNNIINDIGSTAELQSNTSDQMYQKVTTISMMTDQISQQIRNIAVSTLGKTVIVDQTSSSAKELKALSEVFQNALVPFAFNVSGVGKGSKRSAIRVSTRIPCKFQIVVSGQLMESTITSADYDAKGVIVNLSAGGCVIETANADVEQGKYLILSFQIGSNFLQGLHGRLVRIRDSRDSSADFSQSDDFEENLSVMNTKPSSKFCVVAFNNVTPDQEQIILDYVMNAQKQFETDLGLVS